MAVILALKGVRKSHEHKKTRIGQSIIMMEKASNERVGGPHNSIVLVRILYESWGLLYVKLEGTKEMWSYLGSFL